MYVIGRNHNGKLNCIYAQVYWTREDAEFAKASMNVDAVIFQLQTVSSHIEDHLVTRFEQES